MTRDEAIKELKEYEDGLDLEYATPFDKAILYAIKALEQEPQTFKWCTDCKEYDQEKHCCHRYSKVIRDTVEEMKQEQEPKMGHWIRVAGGSLIDDYRCDCCNHQPPIRKVGYTWGWDFTNYCPNCGAKMEDKE